MSHGFARILVLRRRALGDLVTSLAALDDLRSGYPAATIDLVMDPPFVEAALAWAPVSRVLSLPRPSGARWSFARGLRRAGYDLAIDLHGTPLTAILTWASRAPRRVGLDLSGRSWAYTHRVTRLGSAMGEGGRPPYIADALRAVVAAALPPEGLPARSRYALGPAHHPPRRVALAPGATWRAKAWPEAHYARLADLVRERWNAEVTIFWGPGEEALARRIADRAPGALVAEAGTVVEFGKRLQEFDLLLSGDSGARHLAQRIGVRTVAVFGPTDPWTQTPPGGAHRWLRHPIACAPCQLAACPLAENYCMTRVTPEDLMAVATRAGAEAR